MEEENQTEEAPIEDPIEDPLVQYFKDVDQYQRDVNHAFETQFDADIESEAWKQYCTELDAWNEAVQEQSE